MRIPVSASPIPSLLKALSSAPNQVNRQDQGSQAATSHGPATQINFSPLAQMALANTKLKNEGGESETMKTLKQSEEQMKADRKAFAVERLAMIKKQLETLRSLNADPKVAAKQAAALSKELRAAAKDYAEAAGGSAPEAGAPPMTDEVKADQQTKTKDGADAQDQTEKTEKMADEEAQQSDFDKAVLDEFKNTASDLRRMMRASLHGLQGAKSDHPDIKALRKEMNELDKDMGDISSSDETPQSSVDIRV